MKADRTQLFVVGFLLLEAVGATLWWLMLWLAPQTRRFFLPPRVPEIVLFAFALPDALLFIGAALAAAWGLRRKTWWAKSALWLHCGAVWYATLFTVALALLGNGGFLGAASMTLCALALTVCVARFFSERN